MTSEKPEAVSLYQWVGEHSHHCPPQGSPTICIVQAASSLQGTGVERGRRGLHVSLSFVGEVGYMSQPDLAPRGITRPDEEPWV